MLLPLGVMNPNRSPKISDESQPSNRPFKHSRLWQLGVSNAMSPGVMSADGPSPEPAWRAIGIHHSFSTPQMQPWSNEEYAGHSSARYTTGPSTVRGSGNNFAAREEGIRLSNISKMTEPSYGSPSRFIGKSPNPRDQPSNHAARPAGLAFGGYGERAQSDHAGPKSAPANVKSFDDRAKDEGFRPWNRDDIDDRWGHQIDEVPSSTNNSTSRQTSHWDLLQAQLGYTGVQPNGQDQNGTIPATFDTPDDVAASDAFVGRGYDNLAKYVAIASSGQQRARVPELERLMMTMLNLRGDNNGLLSIDHSGRDTVRQYMYEQIFDAADGSSRLSKDNPESLVNVGGELMTRQALHHQIMCFLEDKLEDMIRSPSPQVIQPEAEFQSAKTHRPQASIHLALPETSFPGQQEESPSIRGFEALSLGQQQGGPQQAWQGSTDVGIYNMSSQGQPREQHRVTPDLSDDGYQNLPYGQLQYGMVPHQLHGSLSSQLVGPHGLFYGNPYAAPPMASMGFYHGGQAVPNVGPMMPYGAPYMRMPQQGNPVSLPHAMPNQQMIMNPYQQQIGRGPSNMMPLPPSQWTPVPGYLGSVYASMNRAQSPLIRNPNSAFQARIGRSVVSEVALLPYRPGSDDMFPYGQQGGSVQFQELTRNGGPTYDQAIQLDILPFAENARKAKPAEWGVLRIGNIPYTLTKQEVLGFLGRNAKIITPEYGVAVHIIMDRPTGKTMDCYVEFFSQGDAQAALNKCLMRGNQLRLGDRVVDVHMSSQNELLKELFPRAKNCTWEHGRPKITESREPYNTGFKAFVTNEELLQTVTWADKPHRKCMQRPYECMISTLAKFPWFCVDRYTIKTRDELFKSTLSLINILMNELNKANEMYQPNISETLLIDLLYAALNVPAFSEQQRWRLRKAASTTGAKVRMSPLAEVWPFEVLGRKVGIDEDVVQKYAHILQSHPANTSKDTAFGEWTALSNEALGLQTIGQIGTHEMEMLMGMLGDVLPQSL